MMSRTLRLSDGSPVRVIDAGPAEAEPVVLIHGVGMRAEAWRPQIAALSAGFHVVAADMPGHGGTAPLPDTARLGDFVAWAARFVEALDLGPVIVAGHSMGALIAAGLAVERPDLVRRVAMLNAVHRRSPEARAAVIARADQLAQGDGTIDVPLTRWFGDDQAAIRDEVGAMLRQMDLAGYATAYRSFAEGDAVYADRLDGIACPALVLTGDGDQNSTPAMTRAMAERMPMGHGVVVPGHRHMVSLTAPEIVNQAMLAWLHTKVPHDRA